MDYEREIPFGVFDSELMHQEISIPDGFTATIEGDKIILTRTEDEYEKIRKWIKKELENKYVEDGIVNNVLADKAFAWLEKQKHLYETTKDRFYLEGFEEGQLYEKQKEQKPTEWSEEDEKIRKKLLSAFKGIMDYADKDELWYGLTYSDILAWLEKQGEQKSIDDLSPQEAMDIAVAKCFEQGERKPVFEMKTPEESLGIDSDTYNKIVDECIYGEQKSTELAKGEDYGIDGLWHAQRILEKTLGEVDGYQTDDGILDHKAAITAVKKLYGQEPTDNEMKTLLRTEYEKGRADAISEMEKPTWSVEDMSKVQRICKYLDEAKKYYADITEVRECTSWLKSLNERVQPKHILHRTHTIFDQII